MERTLKVLVIGQFVVIAALLFLLYQRSTPVPRPPSRVETALADIRGALNVGMTYGQLQERLQALSAAIEQYKSEGGGSDLQRFETSLRLYQESLELWSLKDSDVSLPPAMKRIAKAEGITVHLSEQKEIVWRIGENNFRAEALMRELWRKAAVLK